VIDAAVHVEIPEDVRLSFRLAGPGPRALAYVVDLALRAILFLGFLIAVSLVRFVDLGGLSWGLLLVLVFFMEWGYGWLFEGFWNGQTPGKRAFGLRVVREDGHTAGVYEAMVRNLLRAADVLPAFYAVGLVTMSVTSRFQRLGDLMAGTMVVHESRETLRRETPDFEGASLLARDELAAAWRPPERTLDLIHAFALRRAQLGDARAREIARILAEPLARRLDHRSEELRRQPDRWLLRVYRTFQARP